MLKSENYPAGSILVDAYKSGCYGGTGKISDWKLAIKVKETHQLILAGGLNAENIREAIEAVRPQAVDISSGVEISPGKKDRDKIRRIIQIVRETEKQQQIPSENRQTDDARIFTVSTGSSGRGDKDV